MTFEGHSGNLLIVFTLCSQLMHDLLAVAEFLVVSHVDGFCSLNFCILFLPKLLIHLQLYSKMAMVTKIRIHFLEVRKTTENPRLKFFG